MLVCNFRSGHNQAGNGAVIVIPAWTPSDFCPLPSPSRRQLAKNAAASSSCPASRPVWQRKRLPGGVASQQGKAKSTTPGV
jgi:hypothetical protein